jgi:hypothetical protein
LRQPILIDLRERQPAGAYGADFLCFDWGGILAMSSENGAAGPIAGRS